MNEVTSLKENQLADVKKFEPLFGEWYISEQLGRGPSATVYGVTSVSDDGRDHIAAVKHIHDPDGSLVGKLEERFGLMQSLSWHPNIVRYDEMAVIPAEKGAENGGDAAEGSESAPGECDIFIRMEQMRGLNVFVREEGLNESSILRLGSQICSALEAISEAGAVHREIKPANILINANGSAKLGDIAIPELLYGEDSFADAESYMSPEVYRREEADIRSDLYSLGLVIYQLLNSNRLPFEPTSGIISLEASTEAIRKRMEGGEIPPINGIVDEANAVFAKACAFRPEDRYQTASEMREALEELLEMESIIHSATISGDHEAAALQAAALTQYDYTPYGSFYDYDSKAARKAMRKRVKEGRKRPDSKKQHAPVWVALVPVISFLAIFSVCYHFGLFKSPETIAENYLTFNKVSGGYSGVLECADGIEEIVIPDEHDERTINTIGSYAFTNCNTIEIIYLPNTIDSVCPAAFYNCRKLRKITIPEKVTVIHKSTFYNCKSLEKLELPDGIVTIGEKAFYGCTSLRELRLPSVTGIGRDAFYGCSENLVIYGEPGSYVETYCERHNLNFKPID